MNDSPGGGRVEGAWGCEEDDADEGSCCSWLLLPLSSSSSPPIHPVSHDAENSPVTESVTLLIMPCKNNCQVCWSEKRSNALYTEVTKLETMTVQSQSNMLTPL